MDVLLDPVVLLGLVGVGIGVIIPIILIAGRNRAQMPEGPPRSTVSSDMKIASQGQDMSNGAPQPPPGWYESENGRAYWDGESWYLAQSPSEPPPQGPSHTIGDGASGFVRNDAPSGAHGNQPRPGSEIIQEEESVWEVMGGFVIGFIGIWLVFAFFGIFGFSIFGWSVGDLFSDQREIACLEGGGSWIAHQEYCFHSSG